MDIMTKFGFKLNLKKKVLEVNGEKVVLNRREEVMTRVVLVE